MIKLTKRIAAFNVEPGPRMKLLSTKTVLFISVTKAIAGLHIRALLWFVGIHAKVTMPM